MGQPINFSSNDHKTRGIKRGEQGEGPEGVWDSARMKAEKRWEAQLQSLAWGKLETDARSGIFV